MSQSMIPDLWAQAIYDAYTNAAVPRRMIDADKLQALVEESSNVPQLLDIHDALRELQWRRNQEHRAYKRITELSDQIRDLRIKKTPLFRRIIQCLKFRNIVGMIDPL